MPDRRRAAAQPGVPSRWLVDAESTLESQFDTQVDSLKGFAASLRGSRPLAMGIVNSMWKLVHGRPLSGQVSHPMSAPMSDELLKIERDLVGDLMRSGFDINRTLTLILMSPTTRRSVPDSLRDVWATDQSDAHQKTIAFAGSLPVRIPLSLASKLDQSLRAIGAKLSTGNDELLAQIGSDGQSNGGNTQASTLAWDFPDRADSMPVQWLQSVDGTDARIEHLCYLAGMDQVPASIDQAAGAMRKSGLDEATLLHRIWWLAQSR